MESYTESVTAYMLWCSVMYGDILNQIVNWFVSLYGWNKFSLINESEAGLAPNCYNELRSSHNHQMVMKCTWTRWPVGTELASCFSKNNVASGDTGLHKSKFLTLLHPLGTEKWLLRTAVFIARVLTAEITACTIASSLSTCRHFAGKTASWM